MKYQKKIIWCFLPRHFVSLGTKAMKVKTLAYWQTVIFIYRPQWLLLVNVGVMGLALGFTVVPSLDLVFSSGEAS